MSFKICIIGCGGHSQTAHGPSLHRYAESHPNTFLAGCCDINTERANMYKEKFGFANAYFDFDSMIESEKPNAISVVLPEDIQGVIVSKLLHKKIPLLIEKPPGNDFEEISMLSSIAKKNKIPTMVAFNRRFHPINSAMKKILSDEFKFTDIQNIRYEMLRKMRFENNFWATAIHGIDAVKFLAESEYKHIDFFYQNFYELGTNVSSIYMYCTFDSGATAQLSFCPATGSNYERIVINMLDNTFELDTSYSIKGLLVQKQNRNQVVREIKGDDLFTADLTFDYAGYYHENEYFFNCIRNGILPKCSIESSLQVMKIADCISRRASSYDSLWD